MATLNTNYRVTLYERARPGRQFQAYLGPTPPTPQDGGGGYQVVTLPQRGAITIWQGRPLPVTLSLPLRLFVPNPYGAARADTTLIQPRRLVATPAATVPQPLAGPIGRLISMWRPQDADVAPPVLKMRANQDLVPYSYLPFVMTDFQWGTATADNNGHRYIQDLTLLLLEYRHDEQLQPVSTQGGPASKTRYRVRHGDTLQGIARRFHIPGGWQTLGRVQHPPITDPRKIRVGQRLSIPEITAHAPAASAVI